MRTASTRDGGRGRRGYTLIELLVVMGIIMLMITLVLVSVGSMLRSSRMARTVSLFVGAVDEGRTAAITYRRSTKLDLTRIDPEGRYNRLTVVGPFFNDNFDSYNDATAAPPEPTPSSNGWVTSGNWVPNTSVAPLPSITSDGTRCLRMQADKQYWNVCARIDTVKQDDFEMTVMGRVKFLPRNPRDTDHTISVLVAIRESGASISDAYAMSLTISPAAGTNTPGRNLSSKVLLGRLGGGALTPVGAAALQQVELDVNGAPSATTCLVENVWYRVNLSVKLVTDGSVDPPVAKALVAGKVWADGQLEPWGWTVGPLQDNNPLGNGTGGFAVAKGDALLDDVLFDARPIRVIPAGLRVDAMRAKPATPDSVTEADWEMAPEDSSFSFPILFRPDGTAAERYVLRITDLTSGDRRYVTIDQNTGRARLEHSLKDAIQK